MPGRANHAVMDRQRRKFLVRHAAENVLHDGAVQVLKLKAFAGEEELPDRLVVLFKSVHQGAVSAELTSRVVEVLFPALIMNRPDGLRLSLELMTISEANFIRSRSGLFSWSAFWYT